MIYSGFSYGIKNVCNKNETVYLFGHQIFKFLFLVKNDQNQAGWMEFLNKIP